MAEHYIPSNPFYSATVLVLRSSTDPDQEMLMFDDTNGTDIQILKMISDWLNNMYVVDLGLFICT